MNYLSLNNVSINTNFIEIGIWLFLELSIVTEFFLLDIEENNKNKDKSLVDFIY